jgi:hypothetical protein
MASKHTQWWVKIKYNVVTRNCYEVLGNELPNNNNNSGMSSSNYGEDQYIENTIVADNMAISYSRRSSKENTAEQQSQTSKVMQPKTSREVSTNEDQIKASSETRPQTYNSGNKPRHTVEYRN